VRRLATHLPNASAKHNKAHAGLPLFIVAKSLLAGFFNTVRHKRVIRQVRLLDQSKSRLPVPSFTLQEGLLCACHRQSALAARDKSDSGANILFSDTVGKFTTQMIKGVADSPSDDLAQEVAFFALLSNLRRA